MSFPGSQTPDVVVSAEHVRAAFSIVSDTQGNGHEELYRDFPEIDPAAEGAKVSGVGSYPDRMRFIIAGLATQAALREANETSN